MLLLHSIFNWFWDPGFIKYWLIPLYVLWFVIGLFLAHLQATSTRFYRPALIATAALIAVTVLLNFTTEFYPDSRPENNPWRMIAATLSEQSQPADLFISDAHPLDFYIAYFSKRNALSADLIGYASAASTDESVAALVNEHIRWQRQNGGSIYLYSANDVEALAQRFGLDAATLEAAWVFPALTIYRLP
jgi:hypothetical protein